MAYRFISGATANPMCELGWKSLGVLELTALPSIKKEYWAAAVQEADTLPAQLATAVAHLPCLNHTFKRPYLPTNP